MIQSYSRNNSEEMPEAKGCCPYQHKSMFFSNSSALSAEVDGQSNAGSVIINGRDRVVLDDSSIQSFFSSDGNATGSGGDIRITSGSLFLTNGTQLDTSTRGRGNAGDVVINARNHVFLAGIDGQFRNVSTISSDTRATAQGRGGSV